MVLPSLEAGGRSRSLVSAYDALKEAERWSLEVSGGTVAVFGAGGRAAADALGRRNVRLMFWIEPREEVWRSLFTWEDWTPWLAEDHWVPVFAGAEDWGRCLQDRYHPLWDGAFRTLEWRSAVQGSEELWQPHRKQTVTILESLASDTSTQARFGERWYRNTLVNLKGLASQKVEGCPGATVVVAGAGPGLEDALDDAQNLRWLDERPRSGNRLFATDTAFPALTQRGIVPDLVLCLDGQLPTYHHFVPSHPAVPLVADLASIPLLGRLGMPVVRYLSGHPFGHLIRRHFPELPVLDGSLGNVSGLGLTTAMALGAAKVETWGVGFTYRQGQAYARGTYVYELAGRRASRLQPAETTLTGSCYGAAGLERSWNSQGQALDTTPLLRDYKRRWERVSVQSPVVLGHGSAGDRWQRFVGSWRSLLLDLPFPPPGRPFHGFVRSLESDHRIGWWALWPLALALHRQGVPFDDLPRTVIQKALSSLQD